MCGHLFSWGGQLCLSSNQIAGFLDHQNLLKESIDIFDFLHEHNHQEKAVTETTSFLLVVVSFTSRLIRIAYLWNESHDTLVFLHELIGGSI